MSKVILVLLWLFVGCVISIPYSWLANGSFDDFLATAYVAPVASLVLFVIYMIRRVHIRYDKYYKRYGIVFWMAVAYFCLPILMNGVSVLLKWEGYETISRYVFKGRYDILLGLLISFVLYALIADGITILRRLISKGSSTP